jgi:hypothetical protein
MRNWIKSVFGKPRAENSEKDGELLKQFELLLVDRMEKFYPEVKAAFSTLIEADFPSSTKGLHFEVFLDDPAFSFRLFSKGKTDVWADEPKPVQEFNNTIESYWPIVTQDELDQYMIWEDDPKWERQVALEQPLDKLNIPRIILPWLKKIVSETRGDFSQSITASVHDITSPEEL